MWIEKYSPKKLSQYVGNKYQVEILKKWIKNWGKSKDQKNAVFLSGLPGIGKTSLVYLMAKEFNYDLIEINGSSERSKDTFINLLKHSEMKELFSKYDGKIILIEEIDGINNRIDNGGTTGILTLIKKTKIPIILTANERWKPCLKTLRSYSLEVVLSVSSFSEIYERMKVILWKENLRNIIKENVIRIIKSNKGDIRGTISDLEGYCLEIKKTNCGFKRESCYREKEEYSLFDNFKKATNKSLSYERREHMYGRINDLGSFMSFENYIPRDGERYELDNSYKRRKTDMKIIEEKSELLSLGDIMGSRYLCDYEDYFNLEAIRGLPSKQRLDFPKLLGNISSGNKRAEF